MMPVTIKKDLPMKNTQEAEVPLTGTPVSVSSTGEDLGEEEPTSP